MNSVLRTIVGRKQEDEREAVPASRTAPITPLLRPGFTLIAEIKKASPSKGVFSPAREPVELAHAYSNGGASALSVLTERNFFHGSMEDLMEVKAAMSLPVLRKDFLVREEEIEESYRAGADAVLLIAAVLEGRLGEMVDVARSLGIASLVEVHDEAELELALSSNAALVGINNRNLNTFEVRLETCFELKKRIPTEIPVIAESGFSAPDEIARLQEAGFAGALIGESLVTSSDPEQCVALLLSALTEPPS